MGDEFLLRTFLPVPSISKEREIGNEMSDGETKKRRRIPIDKLSVMTKWKGRTHYVCLCLVSQMHAFFKGLIVNEKH